MFTPRREHSTLNEMAYKTPQDTQMSFSRELRQVLQERNLLTAKSRKKICTMLDRSNGSVNGASPNPEANKRRNFRLQAIEEILSSEKTYLSQLEMLMEYFVRPLKDQAVIDDASHATLFGQIEMIHNLNGEFLTQLQANMENVAGAFLRMAPFFKLYSVYAFDYRKSLLILQELTSKNPVFRKFLAETESRPEVQRKLNSLMIVPIQRVPRYRLLLEQVLLYTSPADADFKLLKESVKQIESTVSHINSCVEDQEITQLLINLQNSLANRSPNIVKPSRKVIKEGVLQKITRNGTEIKRYCVLMSDIFMYCKVLKERAPHTVVENSLECCCIFPLKKCKVYEMFPGNFKITCQGDGIIFGTSDLQLSRAWVGFIRDAIDLHIQCRQTLRKESSKRKPIRKKDMKNFDNDSVLSPSKRKCDYETIFRNKNRSSDSEGEQDSMSGQTSCFQRKAKPLPTVFVPIRRPPQAAASVYSNIEQRRKRPAPPVPPPNVTLTREAQEHEAQRKSIFRLYQFIAQKKPPSRTSTAQNAPSSNVCGGDIGNGGYSDVIDPMAYNNFTVTRYSDSKSYFRANNVDNTLPTTVRREDVFYEGHPYVMGAGSGGVNFRDVLYPLRSSGGSNKSASSANGWSAPDMLITGKENDTLGPPPHKKRVQFNDNQQLGRESMKPQPYFFPSGSVMSTAMPPEQAKLSLRAKIYDFFANLF